MAISQYTFPKTSFNLPLTQFKVKILANDVSKERKSGSLSLSKSTIYIAMVRKNLLNLVRFISKLNPYKK
jgi:hypothetical protein